jgi:hypothetical protein
VSPLGKVRPHLERISGEWCHVVETHWPGHPKHGSIIWLAAEKGGLPMKYEEYDSRGKCWGSMIVQKIAATDTQTGRVWYPQEATRIQDIPGGTLKYRFTCHELRVNVETSEDTWKFSFPVGTRVVDYAHGIYYVVGSGETPGGERMMLGILDEPERTEPAPLSSENENGGIPLDNRQYVSKVSTEPNKAEVQSGCGTESPIAVTNPSQKQFGLIAVVLCLFAVIACGGGIFLWKKKAGRTT